jgi:hypothetical protein
MKNVVWRFLCTLCKFFIHLKVADYAEMPYLFLLYRVGRRCSEPVLLVRILILTSWFLQITDRKEVVFNHTLL